ncbi:phosphotransferase [Microbacterium sp. Mu-80]|uniref:Phosphotransferase n=1 Tax=Microbacterium bandirmense TaxID=3122050 RepID=A0ABU8L9A0_9MICO
MPDEPDAAFAPAPAHESDLAMLRDALGYDDTDSDDHALPEPGLRSREPLGPGAVTGFDLDHAGGMQTWFVDTSRLAVQAETGMSTGEDPVHPDARIWLHPADPHLPALAAAAFGHSAAALLARLGMTATGDIAMIGYRPGRRAVLRVATNAGDAWIKVVRPSRVDRLVSAHRACADGGLPVPTLLGWASEGLIVLDSAIGTPAAEVPWRPGQLLDEVDALRERIAHVAWDRPAKSIADRLDWYAGHAGDDADAARLVRGVRALLAGAPQAPRSIVHGDLHFGQVFLDESHRVSGVIDVDTFGVGVPAEDSAAFIAHAVASARLTGAIDSARVWRLADHALRRWDAADVRAFTGIHLLGQANAARDNGDVIGARELSAAALRIVDGDGASPL